MGSNIKGRSVSGSNKTRVLENLYIGSAPPVGDDLKEEEFSILWLCAEEYQPKSSEFPGVEVHRMHLKDQGQEISNHQVREVKEDAALLASQIKTGSKILVTCRMGLVRSATMIVAALKILSPNKPLKDIISTLRKIRDPRVLASDNWVDALNRMFPEDKSNADAV